MYSQSIDYIDSITHSSSYFTDAECNARYFTSANDGSGSGLIAATLDGYTADQIIAAGSPSGVIAWWSGSEASIPSGWVLCNGLNGTPDLRDRFVVGSGSHYTKGSTGGLDEVTTTGAVTIAGHALTAAETPKHTHGNIVDYYASGIKKSGAGTGVQGSYANSTILRYTDEAGGGDAHSHTASYVGSEQSKLPPFYAICFIMKV